MARKRKIILRRVGVGMPDLIRLIKERKLDNKVFLCRKNDTIFTSVLYFVRTEDLEEGEEPNVSDLGTLFVLADKIKVPVHELSEMNLIVLQ